MSDGLTGYWVVGSYQGERAKSVLAHAESGIGYIILENDGNRFNPDVKAAFRFVPDEDGIPEHLIEVTDPFKIAKYEKIRQSRMGHDKERSTVVRATSSGVENARNIYKAVKAKGKE